MDQNVSFWMDQHVSTVEHSQRRRRGQRWRRLGRHRASGQLRTAGHRDRGQGTAGRVQAPSLEGDAATHAIQYRRQWTE